METHDYKKAAWLALALVLLFVAGWEIYWRNQGFALSFNDDESLWAHNRKKIYNTAPGQPVIIGSSRVKFDIDQETWEKETGYKPVQLALVGTSPRPILRDLANDPKFKGTVLVGITEGLFFSADGSFMEDRAAKRLAFYPRWSLSQQVSFQLNHILESNLIFLDEERFSLNSLLKRLPIESRPGVFVFPNFPLQMGYTMANRQEVFSDAFMADTAVQHGVQYVWSYLGMLETKRGFSGDTLSNIISSVKGSVDKIRARGGSVTFLRMPSSDPAWSAEKQTHPRELYWDRLLRETGAPGIHFTDYPELSKYICPDWSHLSPADTKPFTKDLIRIIEEKNRVTLRKTSAIPKIQ
ncbi:hypothetical protein [Dyadobacter fanqingshengii]|uniref:Uncharacterized protein n=1 Tax=Dyadobacter fanqingshengii TaxID=2906443 RepID=A0A9X1PAN7_9BACT|nr:hypothetical protein [Dyadobacter fanqingshengii]MCF0041110.1 hypothetical protein [Dyadobacter fanqingshengii]USJ37163.1 hypothetical protein NFI81_05150 [Dyadobacter fanqingshengii]